MDVDMKKGSLFGAILLISGCCIGAGMLGLPVLSALAGFTPSLFIFFLSWLFMTCTGLLLLEVNLWFKEDVSIISMAGRTLGRYGQFVGWIVFLFLFYALMVAYVSGSAHLVVDFFKEYAQTTISPWVGSLAFVILLGILLYLGTAAVDRFNRILMFGLIFTYLLLVGIGIPHVNIQLLKHHDWTAVSLVIPAMIVSFGFHNLIPSLKTYLNSNAKKLQLAIIIGSAIPLLVYIVWEFLILGIVPIEGVGGFRQALGDGEMATQALKNAIGSSWIVNMAHFFAFFAITTSFLGVALSFVDFLADGLHIKKTMLGKIILCGLVLFPPTIFSLVYPKIFLIALNYAGGFGAVILFGLLPALMVWSGRYVKKMEGIRIVPGGKPLLALVIGLSLGIIALQLFV
jgi:tyrosine-specific transport protein